MIKPLAIVTGSAQGLGKSLVRELSAHYWVVGYDIAETASPVSELAHSQNEVTFPAELRVDVTDESALRKATELLAEKYGPPALWINNAGRMRMGRFETVDSTEFDRILETNLNGTIYGSRVALEYFDRLQRGTLVNMASVAGFIAAPFSAAYVASKHAIVGFTQALRLEREFQKSPVKVALVCPGFVNTAMMAKQNEYAFPEWLDFAVSAADATAKNIVAALLRGETEIVPTSNGKILMWVHRLSPKLAEQSSRILMAKSLRQALGLDKIR